MVLFGFEKSGSGVKIDRRNGTGRSIDELLGLHKVFPYSRFYYLGSCILKNILRKCFMETKG